MKTLNIIIINVTTLSLIVFLSFLSFDIKSHISSDSKIEIEFIKSMDTLNVDNKLNERILILENNVDKIEEINNKRFELLGWGFAILITTFSLFLIVNYVNSKATMRDMVYDEINDKNKNFQKQYDELLKDMKEKRELIDSEVNKTIKSMKKISDG